MFQIDNDTAASSLPASTSEGVAGYFTDGNPATGLAATVLPAEFMNMLMMEFINVITEAGLEPSKSDYTQLSQAIPILIAKLATVDWSNVTNAPTDLVSLNTSPSLSGLELNSATPSIDFHFNGDSSDYNFRLVNGVDGGLQFVNKTATLLTVGPGDIGASVKFLAKAALVVWSQAGNGSLNFHSADGATLDYCFKHDDTSFSLYAYPEGKAGVLALSMARATGAISFSARPTFAGATPFDSLNFDPTKKADAATTLEGYGITDAVLASEYSQTISTLNSQVETANTQITAANEAIETKQDNLGFTPVRQGGGVSQLDNPLLIGWDGTAVRVTVDAADQGALLTDANLSSYLPAKLVAMGVGEIGTYGFFRNGTSSTNAAGTLVSGGSLAYGSTGSYSGAPAGTWRCAGYAGSGNHTLYFRVA